MITFVGGPAVRRQGILIQRAPRFLRVVEAEDGAIDTLDQLQDTPRDGERVHVYQRLGSASPVHVCARGRGAVSGWGQLATYVHMPEVDGEQLRGTGAWRTWCTHHAEALL